MTTHREQEVVRESDIWPNLCLDSLQKAGQRAVDLSMYSLKRLEQQAIEQVLCLCGNNKTRASQIMGISRESLYHKMRQYGIPL